MTRKIGCDLREIKIRCGANKKCRQFEQRQQCFSARIKNKNTKTKQWGLLVRTGGVKYYGGRLFFNISLALSLASTIKYFAALSTRARYYFHLRLFIFILRARPGSYVGVKTRVGCQRRRKRTHLPLLHPRADK